MRNTSQENNCVKKENRSLKKQLQSCQEAEKIALGGLNKPINMPYSLIISDSTQVFLKNSLAVWNLKRLSFNLQIVFVTTVEVK